MRLATAQQAREIDELSVSAYGLTGDILMESAGTLAAREIQLNFFPELGRGQVAVVCGPGNNGGDGLVVARHLHAMGFRDLAVYVLAPPNKQSELFKLQLRRAELHGLRVHSLHRAMKKAEALRSVTLVVDAIFGHGLKTEVQGDYASLIEIINSLKVPKVSVDLPSGLDPDRGVVLGVAVRADMTLSF
jgi:NAD(P)H-hydrate epimerase